MQHQPPTDPTATLRRALAFYADVEVYKPPYAGGEGQIMQDCGQIARKALEGVESEEAEEMTTLNWRCQFQEWQDGTGQQGIELLHFAKTDQGIVEIYDDGKTFLVLFPRDSGIPAHAFPSLEEAKKAAQSELFSKEREQNDA